MWNAWKEKFYEGERAVAVTIQERRPETPVDLSANALYVENTWREPFARLRKEAPLSWRAEIPFGAYWSAVSYDLITQIELDPATWSSSWERGNITIAESVNEVRFPNFVAQDPPIHTAQRKVGIADGPAEVHKVTVAKQHLWDYRDVADPIFPEYSLLHRRRAAEEMYGDPHEVIAAVLETESAA